MRNYVEQWIWCGNEEDKIENRYMFFNYYEDFSYSLFYEYNWIGDGIIEIHFYDYLLYQRKTQ